MAEAGFDNRFPIIIGVAGGTGSGKSTFTNRLKKLFGDHVTVLYYDNYYRAHDDIPFEERKKINYDHPEAFETELLLEHLSMLKEGKAIQCPVYDYTQHNRSGEVVEVAPSPPFFAWVFTFAGSIRIINPPETVEKFREMAKNAIL